MPELIPNQNLSAMFGGSVGAGLGSGLGQGLAALADQKLQELHGARFWKSLGLDDATARSFASAPKEVQKSLLERLEGMSIGSQDQQGSQMSQMGQQLMQQPSQNDFSHLAAQPEGLGQLGQAIQQQIQQQGQPNQLQMMQMLGLLPQQGEAAMSQVSPAQQQVAFQQMQSPMHNQQPGKITLGANPIERRHRETLAQQKELAHEKLSAKERAEINKEVLPFIKETQSKAKAAKESDLRLGRMKELIKTGKLSNPQFAGLLKTLKKGVWGTGIDFTSLLSKESQEFEKLSQDFTKNIRDVFGSNVTNFDLETFLSTIPNLSQTNEGKWAVINNLELLNKGAEIRNKASRDLLKKYGNKLPIDFESQVDDLIQPQMQSIAEQFKKGATGQVAKTQPFLKDVLGSVGDILLGQS